jgi:hypothetical protein
MGYMECCLEVRVLAVGIPIMQATGEPKQGDRKEVILWHNVMSFPVFIKI